MRPPPEFLLTAITNDPALIRAAAAAGVNRIGVDIERRGKLARQGHLPNARVSDHRLEDLSVVSANAGPAEVFIRINPPHDGSPDEIERALALGARVVMLPYFARAREIEDFVKTVDGRANPVLLLETSAAVDCIRDILSVGGFTEIMVGLNDFRLSLGLAHPFEAVTSDLMTELAATVQNAGVRFGFGGLARVSDQTLPVPPDLVAAQYPRLGATSAWLSRSFFRALRLEEMEAETVQIRGRLDYWSRQAPSVLSAKKEELASLLRPSPNAPPL